MPTEFVRAAIDRLRHTVPKIPDRPTKISTKAVEKEPVIQKKVYQRKEEAIRLIEQADPKGARPVGTHLGKSIYEATETKPV